VTEAAASSGLVCGATDRHLATRAVQLRLSVKVGVALALLLAALTGLVLWMCDGRLIYSLDDPYISLSLSWHIAHGHYGINAGEASSPSSSILYPLILAPFAYANWQEWVPLALNAAAAVATGVAFATAACRFGIVTPAAGNGRAATLIVILCASGNLLTLPFTGLEHSLHALTSVLIVFGLARVIEEDDVPRWLPALIVLVPLWRFEGLALALLAIAALVLMRQWRSGAAALIGIAVSLGAYMAVMHALGLPMLPSSVLAKSAASDRLVGGESGLFGFVGFVLRDAIDRLRWEATPTLLVLALVVAHPVLRVWGASVDKGQPDNDSWSLWREGLFTCVVAGALIAHVLFGGWGWFARYEIYTVFLGSAGAMILWRRGLGSVVQSVVPTVAIALVLVNVGSYYLLNTIRVPAAAREIYEQQYQMHRFAVDFYRGPVGVNDLGWVSYHNPNYVLDLWGLGSEAAREDRMHGGAGADWLDRLVKSHNVGVLMIYDKWFSGQIPPDWSLLAVLRTSHHVVNAGTEVAFYATSPAAAAAGRTALAELQRHLLAGSTLTIFPDRMAPAAR
jgi:hypothetical protein